MRVDPRFAQLRILDHPLIQHKLSLMRERATPTAQFRQLLRELTLLMGYEVTRLLPLEERPIDTPLAPMRAPHLAGRKLVVVPVLRAGLAMAEGLLELVPSARVGHIGVYRGDDLQPVEYMVKLPDLHERPIIVCDPMLATGASAVHAVQVLRTRGAQPEQITFLALVAAPEGVTAFERAHPGVPCYVAALDSHLDEHAYIVPGLGDAGDRLYGTK
jgi:uracil phosphoribosyltransferase